MAAAKKSSKATMATWSNEPFEGSFRNLEFTFVSLISPSIFSLTAGGFFRTA
jgi:hypothetical protein